MGMKKEYLELEDFEGSVGREFIISVDGVEETVIGELVGAKHITSDTLIERKPFCIDFKFPAGANLGQSLYQVEGGALEAPISIFLIPYRGDEDGWYMTAQFN